MIKRRNAWISEESLIADGLRMYNALEKRIPRAEVDGYADDGEATAVSRFKEGEACEEREVESCERREKRLKE
jgi:hypothetical protein